MTREQFEEVRDNLLNEAFGVSKAKGKDYSRSSEDMLYNFKSVGERLGQPSVDVLMVYMLKHQDAIENYVKSKGQSESEPIRQRIIDNINYLTLLYGLLIDEGYEQGERKQNEA